MRRYDVLVEDRAIDLYRSGIPVVEIGKTIGVDTATVYNIFKRRRVPLRRGHRRANLRAFAKNGEYTAEQKYWAGFLLADGCVSDTGNGNPCLMLGLQDQDKAHVEKFAHFLQSTHAVNWHETSQQWMIQVRSNFWVEDLAPFGVTPRKSLIACIPNEFKGDRDFWRGLIDGNGCVRWTSHEKYKLPSVAIAGTESICSDFAIVGERLTGVRMKVRPSSENCYACSYAGQKASIFLKWLYKDASVYLDRKHSKAQEMF